MNYHSIFRQGGGFEDRATRGTKAGGPQAKRSGGVSEANVREPPPCRKMELQACN